LGISFSKRTFQPDEDRDGIPDIHDLQPRTPKGWPVNSQGQALDSDFDGIPDGVDKELNTPAKAVVDRHGRALDSDKDGVPDGIDQEEQTPKGALVDQLGRTRDSDGDGVPDGIDKEPNTRTGAVIDVRGVSIDSDGDGVPDGIDIEPATAAGALVDVQGKALPPMELELIKKGLLRVHKIYFNVGQASIKPESFEVLNEISRILQRHKDLKIQINGHTDADGSDEFNLQLSIERANNVRYYIMARASDIPSENLTTMGFGRKIPLSDNNTPEGRILNRRVEFVVINEK
jgi:OOP family OmpA-OmpF porin